VSSSGAIGLLPRRRHPRCRGGGPVPRASALSPPGGLDAPAAGGQDVAGNPIGGGGPGRETGMGGRGGQGLGGGLTDHADGLFTLVALDFQAWRAGQREALGRMVTSLTPVLWHVVRAYGLDRESAEDVVQVTWMSLVRHGEAIDDPQAVVRWLTVTARREAWRSSRVRRREEPTEDGLLDLRHADGEDPEAAAMRSERDEALWAAVRRLNERCRRLLRVVAFAERPDYARLAADLGMAQGSVGPTRGRCLDKLRSLLSAGDWRMG
jgi:RNA polymerase sigma factor (sigma-70 family)